MMDESGNSAALTVGQAAPHFELLCTDLGLTPQHVRLEDYRGRWLILVFYPRDFSFVCPTELTAFSARVLDFRQRECELLGISVDSIELHQEWLSSAPEEGGLGPLQFPLASDPEGEVSRAYGVWQREKHVSTRGLFIIDPRGLLQYAVVHNLSVGRSTDEVLRVLDALRNGGLCPAGWTSADGTLDPEAALRRGRVLGHYRIREVLGSGNFGTVFAAWDLRLERRVALKVLRRNVFASRDALLAEARSAARLNHPNLCTVYTVDEEDGLPVIAMEYLDGRTLADAIGDGIDPAIAGQLATQIASGIALAHAHNVVHGDLKPANIFVTEDGVPKVLDFGLARSQESGSESRVAEAPRLLPSNTTTSEAAADSVGVTIDCQAQTLTASAGQGTDGLRGTPAYMSPEQARGMASTTASDVFSFGLTLFEMLTGRRALTGESVPMLLEQLLEKDVAADLLPHVDRRYRPLLSAVLSRDASHRPSMSVVAEALSR